MRQLHFTVAAIIEQQQQFVLVSDKTAHGIRLNQPAGHVEAQEDPLTAIKREVYEETSLIFTPTAVTGVYVYHPNREHTYLRLCFSGSISDYTQIPQPQANDEDVVAAAWYDLAQIQATTHLHRSSLVLTCIHDYLAGKRYPLHLVQTILAMPT